MLSSDPIHEPLTEDAIAPAVLRRRVIFFAGLSVLFLLAFFLPPYINVNRLQRRISTNIGASLGRPVHFSNVSLTLLPLPGFTLDNFVVEEEPAFGAEPVLRAGQVRVTLRLGSIWGRRVEFSRISLTDPSVNLVHTSAGRWNIEPLLLQASHIEAAPTAQLRAGPAPRFPYIEASGARINLKLGQEKTPVSLTDADFSLWLPEPHQWRFRLEAHPVRTDIAPGDTGTIRLEATLGGGRSSPSLADVPIDLRGTWEDAQLGGLSRLLLARDAGLRGELTLNLSLAGTLGRSTIASNLKIARARRADFVPPQLLSLEAGCRTASADLFHAFPSIECRWPPAGSSGPGILIASAAIPDVRAPDRSSVDLTLPSLPVAALLDWLRAATPYPPVGLLPTGTLTGTAAWRPQSGAVQSSGALASWSGELEFSGGTLQIDPVNHRSISLGDIVLRSTPPPPPAVHRSGKNSKLPAFDPGFDLLPIALPLGGKQPAVLEGHFDASGYTLHLSGTVIGAEVLRLGNAVPQLGEGLGDVLLQIDDAIPVPCPRGISGCGSSAALSGHPIHVDLTAARFWGGPQTWHSNASPAPAVR